MTQAVSSSPMGLGAMLTFFVTVRAQPRDLLVELVGIAREVGIVTGRAASLFECRVPILCIAPTPVAVATEVFRCTEEQQRSAFPVGVVAFPAYRSAGAEVPIVAEGLSVFRVVRLDHMALETYFRIPLLEQLPLRVVARVAVADIVSVENLWSKSFGCRGARFREEDFPPLGAHMDDVSPRGQGELEPEDATRLGLCLPLAHRTPGLYLHGDTALSGAFGEDKQLVGRHDDAVLGQKDFDCIDGGTEQEDAHRAAHRTARNRLRGTSNTYVCLDEINMDPLLALVEPATIWCVVVRSAGGV